MRRDGEIGLPPSAGAASARRASALPGDPQRSILALSGAVLGSGAEPRPAADHVAVRGHEREGSRLSRDSAVGREPLRSLNSSESVVPASGTRAEGRAPGARMEVMPSIVMEGEAPADELTSAAHEVPEATSPIFVALAQ